MENNAENEIDVEGIKEKGSPSFFAQRISVLLWASCVHEQISLSYHLSGETPVEDTEDNPDTRPLSLCIKKIVWGINSHGRP